MVSINITLVFTIINLIIFYLLMKKFLIGPINGVMEKRAAMIKEQLESAKDTRDEADKLKSQYEASLEGAKEQSIQIVEEAKDRARKEYERILKEAAADSDKMMENSRNNIDRERDKALEEMQSQIAQLAMAAVQKVLPGEISQEENDKYYDRFLKEAGEASETGSH